VKALAADDRQASTERSFGSQTKFVCLFHHVPRRDAPTSDAVTPLRGCQWRDGSEERWGGRLDDAGLFAHRMISASSVIAEPGDYILPLYLNPTSACAAGGLLLSPFCHRHSPGGRWNGTESAGRMFACEMPLDGRR
jgi:hypothetical protein